MGRRPHTDFLRAAVANAFTTVFAGFALTITVFPKISFFPALVAGFTRVLIRISPGSAKMPALFTCSVATLVRLSMILAHWDFLSSHSVASASAMAPLVMGFAAAFIAFMGAMVPGGGQSGGRGRRKGRRARSA